MAKEKLWKTTIEIYSDYNPQGMSISDLGRDAISGDSICGKKTTERVGLSKSPVDVRNFFGEDDE